MSERNVASEVARLPLHTETARILTQRRVTGRVRVSVATRSEAETFSAMRRHRNVEVVRVPLDMEVTEAPATRQDGDTLVISVIEERPVVVTKLFLVEEIRLRFRSEEELVSLSAQARRQHADVSRVPAGDDVPAPPYEESATPMSTATTRTITAMFDTRAEAERAEQSLRSLGIGSERIKLRAVEATGTAARAEDRGILAAIADLFVPDDDRAAYGEGLRRGGVLLTAEIDQAHAEGAMDALEAAGAVDLDEREASWRAEGWTTETTSAGLTGGTNPPGTMASRAVDQVAGTNVSGAYAANDSGATATGRDDEQRIQLAEERLRIGKREAHGGRVRVRSYVVETPVEETVQLREERVQVHRNAVDRAATGTDAELFQERVIEADESIEEAVVAKDVRVTGEVVVNKTVTERSETVRDTVRRTEVEVNDDTVERPRRGA